MKKLRSSPTPPSLAPVAIPTPGLVGSWARFWFTPNDPIGLHALRLLAGLLFLLWLLPLAGQRAAFFGLNGWFDVEAFKEAVRLPGGAPAAIPSWSLCYLGTSPALLDAIYWSSIAILVLFTLGVLPRLTAVLTWVVVASFTWNPAFAYDADAVLLVLAFYLMVGYLLYGLRERGWARRLVGPVLAWPLGGRRDLQRPSLGANLAVRLFQVHFAIGLVVLGLHKLQSGDWWAGVALWYPLHSPLTTTAEMIREEAKHASTDLTLLSLGAYAAMAWQIGFPLFAWRPRWRLVLVAGGLVTWLGNALIFSLPLLGPALFLGCLAYLTPREWRWVLGLVAYVPGFRRIGAKETFEAGQVPVKEPAAALVGGKHA